MANGSLRHEIVRPGARGDGCHYSLDRAERAMAGRYPLLMLTYGCILAIPLFIALSTIHAIALFNSEYYYELGELIGQAGVALTISVISYFYYSKTLFQLGRTHLIIFTILWGLLWVAMIPGFITRILEHIEYVSPWVAIASSCIFIWACGSVGSGCLRLARASDQDRFLMRAPFDSMISKMAIQFSCGLPPIINFVKGAKVRILILTSTLLFGLAFSMVLAGPREVSDAYNEVEQISALVTLSIMLPVLIVSANQLLHRAQKDIRFSIEKITATDPRPPLLFLRAFRDDQVTLDLPHYTPLGRLFAISMPKLSLDHVLLTEGTLYGPMVALGNPRDSLPPYGVARGYVANEHWQDTVRQLAQLSQAIVICVDDTDAIWWEIEHLVGHDHLKKTLFLFHPKFRSQADNHRLISHLLAKLPIDDKQSNSLLDEAGCGNLIGFFFDADDNLFCGGSGLFTMFSYLLMTRWFLRHKFGLYPIAWANDKDSHYSP
jgi:hypothetical protein